MENMKSGKEPEMSGTLRVPKFGSLCWWIRLTSSSKLLLRLKKISESETSVILPKVRFYYFCVDVDLTMVFALREKEKRDFARKY